MTTTLQTASAPAPTRTAGVLPVRRGLMAMDFLLLLVNAFTWIANVAHGEWINTDYGAFFTGWTIVREGNGRSLYDFALQKAAQTRLLNGGHYPGGLLPFVNPPHVAWFGSPVARLSMYHGYLAVAAVNILCAAALVVGMHRCSGPAIAGRNTALAVAASASLAVALTMGAFSVVVALGMLGFVAAMQRADRLSPLLAVAMIGLSCKPQYLVLPLVALLFAGRWRNMLSAIGGLVVAFMVGAAAYGPHIWVDYLRRLQSYGTAKNSFGVSAATMWNVRGVLTLTFGKGAAGLAQTIATGLVLITVVALACAWWRAGMAGRRVPVGAAPAGLVAVTVILAVITSLHAHPQDGVVAIVALAALGPRAVRRAPSRSVAAGSITFADLGLAFPILASIGVSFLRSPAGKLPFLGFTALALLAWSNARPENTAAEMRP